VQEAIDSSRTQLAALQKTYQEQFLEARNAILKKARTETREISADFQGRLLKFYLGFPRLLSELIAQLDIEEREILQAIPNRGVWGLLFPVESDHLRSAWNAWFRRTRKSIRKEQLKFENIEPQTLETLHRAVQLFLKEYTFDLDAMDQETMAIARSLHESRSSAKGVLSKAEDEIREMRTRLIKRFADQVAGIHKGIVDTIQRWNKEIMDSKAAVLQEGKPLGIEF
jgi:vacuolar-type H+-ATPase subunit H